MITRPSKEPALKVLANKRYLLEKGGVSHLDGPSQDVPPIPSLDIVGGGLVGTGGLEENVLDARVTPENRNLEQRDQLFVRTTKAQKETKDARTLSLLPDLKSVFESLR